MPVQSTLSVKGPHKIFLHMAKSYYCTVNVYIDLWKYGVIPFSFSKYDAIILGFR